MTRSTDELIAALAADIQPVRRLKPPMVRAGVWLAIVAALAGVAIGLFADLPLFAARAQDWRLRVELAATLATGIAGAVAAFHLALPDRPRSWMLAPLPFLAVWLAASGAGCWRAWIAQGPEGLSSGPSLDCFLFILGVSLPVGGSLAWALAKAKPLWPASTLAIGGLGAAAIAATLLQFFHPFDVSLFDLGVHAVAVAAVVLAYTGVGSNALKSRPQ
jgi:hypothetical protein